MLKLPHDAERLIKELPKDVLDSIQLELVFFSSHSALEICHLEPTKKQLKKHIKRTMKKHIELLRKAKIKLDKERGDQ